MAIPVALIASLAMSAYQGIKGAQTAAKAKEEAAKAPKSVVPEAAKTALAGASNLAKGRMAGAAEAERSLAESAATAAYRSERGATSSAQYQQAIAGAQAAEQRGQRNIAQMEAQDKVQRENIYINQLMQMAQIQSQVDESNKANAWNIEQSAKAAGRQMQYSAVNTALAGLSMQYGDKEIGAGGGDTAPAATTQTPDEPKTVGDITTPQPSGLMYNSPEAMGINFQSPQEPAFNNNLVTNNPVTPLEPRTIIGFPSINPNFKFASPLAQYYTK